MKAESRTEKWSGRCGGGDTRHTYKQRGKGEEKTSWLDSISPKIPFPGRTFAAFVFRATGSGAEKG